MRALTILTILTLTSCASGLRDTRHAATPKQRSQRSVALFLVDGLGVNALQAGIAKRLLPNVRGHFLRGKQSFPVGQAGFPTQTYPNLASILTARPIGEQPIVANHVVLPNGKIADYEAAENHDFLRAQVEPSSVFGRLEAEGRETASFSYVLGMSATSHMRTGLTEGLEYSRHDYKALDGRLLDELETMLRERPSREWPDFLYVHLVGYDATAHMFGSVSPEALDYLNWLDGRLGPVLRLLEMGEAGRQVLSLLTADHGFIDVKRTVSLRRKLVRADLGLVITNEGRFLGLYPPAGADPLEFAKALQLARATSGVELTAWRRENVLEIEGGGKRYRFLTGPAACGFPVSLSLEGGPYQCARSFDGGMGATYPFLVSQLVRYFSAQGAAQALVIAKPGISFAKGQAAAHGGPTASETFVPALLRGATLLAEGPVPTSDLLRVLEQRQALRPTIENMKRKPTARQASAR